jgi:hypothetical protein
MLPGDYRAPDINCHGVFSENIFHTRSGNVLHCPLGCEHAANHGKAAGKTAGRAVRICPDCIGGKEFDADDTVFVFSVAACGADRAVGKKQKMSKHTVNIVHLPVGRDFLPPDCTFRNN